MEDFVFLKITQNNGSACVISFSSLGGLSFFDLPLPEAQASAEKPNRRYYRARAATLESGMELHLTPDTEAKLNELAKRTRRGTDELLQEAVDHLVAYNEWFARKVQDSQAASARGETVPDEDVRAWLEAREGR